MSASGSYPSGISALPASTALGPLTGSPVLSATTNALSSPVPAAGAPQWHPNPIQNHTLLFQLHHHLALGEKLDRCNSASPSQCYCTSPSDWWTRSFKKTHLSLLILLEWMWYPKKKNLCVCPYGLFLPICALYWIVKVLLSKDIGRRQKTRDTRTKKSWIFYYSFVTPPGTKVKTTELSLPK